MATIRFTGNAAEVAQVDTFTPGGTIEIGDIFILTVTGLDNSTHEITFTATATTVANVTAGLAAAWNASTNALCTPITASDETTNLTLTADTAGVAFSVAASTTEAGGGAADDQTFSRAATTANAGPNDWSSADNFSGGAVPGADADQDVYVEGATILYGLDQSGIANALASLNISQSQIGSNPASGYLAQYLQIKATVVNLGASYGPGTPTESTPVNIDTGSTASTITIFNTGTNSPTTLPAVRIKANSASTVVRAKKGKVGIAFEDGETTTIATLDISYISQANTDADVFLGSGVTVTTITKTGGDLITRCGATTLTSSAGTVTSEGSGAIATANIKGGTFTPNSTGTITALNAIGGTTDFTKSASARTVTTAKIDPGATIKFDPSVVTMTNKIQPYSSTGNISLTAA